MMKPVTIFVTSNKGGSGKTPISINIAAWALMQDPPLKVLGIDINHTNQDFFQAMSHLQFQEQTQYETSFSLKDTGTTYYLPLSDSLHLVRTQTFKPLTPEQIVEVVRDSSKEYAKEHGKSEFKPDIIILDSNYCFPNFRMETGLKIKLPPFIFLNVWSITSPHELRLPKEYRLTIRLFKDIFEDTKWDTTNFIHVFSILEKDRGITSEMMRTLSRRRAVYTVPGSDDLADLYRKIAIDQRAKSEGYSFDYIQREVFSPIMSELDSLVHEDPGYYSEDILNARWVERVNIFLTQTKKFPLNVLPMPHYYPFLRKAVVDMILRERFDLEMIKELFTDFHNWLDLFLTRFFKEHE